jgi:hypothetical protein
MSGSIPPGFTTRIRVVFSPYDHVSTQNLLREVASDFGAPGVARRWKFVSPEIGDPDPTEDGNAWKIDFWFRDEADAVLFALKYDIRKYKTK